jgi:hypothetical protein
MLYGRLHGRVEHITDLSPTGGLWLAAGTGELPDGGRYEIRLLIAVHVDGGEIIGVYVYDESDVDAARASLAQQPPLDPLLSEGSEGNAAWRAALHFADAQMRHDWQRVLDLLDPDYVYIDHRQGVRLRLEGNDALEPHRVAVALDHLTINCSLVATRNDRLALTQVKATFLDRDAGPSEVEMLSLMESGADGRLVVNNVFDLADLDAAYEVLDARAAESSETTENLAWRVARRWCDALNGGDHQAFLDAVAPEFTSVDHLNHLRFAGEDAFNNLRTLFALGDCRMQRTLIETRGDRLVLNRSLISFVDHHAGPSEYETLSLIECGPDGLLLANTVFNPNALDAAYAALERRHAEIAGLEWFENAAWRAAIKVCDAWNRRDWDGFVRTLDRGFTYSDLLRGERLRLDGERALDTHRVLFTLDEFRVHRELLATRGENLVLTRDLTWFVDGDAGPAEVEALSITECGPDGLVVAITSLASDDMNAALDVIDARYVELGGDDFAVMRRSFDARDWETFASLFAPDCRIGDHRTAGWGDVDRNTFIDYQRGVAELAPDAHLWVDRARSRGNVGISTGRVFGTQHGGPWEIAFVGVGVVGPDRASRHFESYDLTDIAVALRRFTELAAEEPA